MPLYNNDNKIVYRYLKKGTSVINPYKLRMCWKLIIIIVTYKQHYVVLGDVVEGYFRGVRLGKENPTSFTEEKVRQTTN